MAKWEIKLLGEDGREKKKVLKYAHYLFIL
jgi:hypothetical protein